MVVLAVHRDIEFSGSEVQIVRHGRTLQHATGTLRALLMRLPESALAGQPLPDQQRTDDRYELLTKLQGVLRSLRIVYPRRGEILWADGSLAVRNTSRCVVRLDARQFFATRSACRTSRT